MDDKDQIEPIFPIEKSKLISVIIPVHQWEHRFNQLRKSLLALCDQSLSVKLFEVIVVNNSPHEMGRAEDILRLFEGKLSLKIISEPKPGSYSARNAGVVQAHGEILAFLDSDCMAESDWLESALSILKRMGNKTIVAGRIKRVAKAGKGNLIERHEKIFALNQRRNVISNYFGATANLILFKSLYSLVGPFRDDLFSGGDFEWCQRAQTNGANLIYAPQAVVQHQVVNSWKTVVNRYRRKAGGNFLLKKGNLILRRKPYSGFKGKFLSLHLIGLLHVAIQGIQRIEENLCKMGKGTIRG